MKTAFMLCCTLLLAMTLAGAVQLRTVPVPTPPPPSTPPGSTSTLAPIPTTMTPSPPPTTPPVEDDGPIPDNVDCSCQPIGTTTPLPSTTPAPQTTTSMPLASTTPSPNGVRTVEPEVCVVEANPGGPEVPSPYGEGLSLSSGECGLDLPDKDPQDVIEGRSNYETEEVWEEFMSRYRNASAIKDRANSVTLRICEIVCRPCDYTAERRNGFRNWWRNWILPALETTRIDWTYRFITTLSFCAQNTNNLYDVYDDFGDFVRKRNVKAELDDWGCDVATYTTDVTNKRVAGLAGLSTACSRRNGFGYGYFVMTVDTNQILVARHEAMHTVSAEHYRTIASDGKTNLMHSGRNVPAGVQRGVRRLKITRDEADDCAKNSC